MAAQRDQDHDQLLRVPIGAGERLSLDRGSIERYGSTTWLPDGERIVFSARETGRGLRLYVQELKGGPPQPITPEQVYFGFRLAASPDGSWVAAQGPAGEVLLYPLGGGEPRRFEGLTEGDMPIRWGTDARSFYFYRTPTFSSYQVYRLDVRSGRRETVKELAPLDPSGDAALGPVVMTADERFFVFGYLRILSKLFVVEGAK